MERASTFYTVFRIICAFRLAEYQARSASAPILASNRISVPALLDLMQDIEIGIKEVSETDKAGSIIVRHVTIAKCQIPPKAA